MHGSLPVMLYRSGGVRICIDLTGVPDRGWGVRTPGGPCSALRLSSVVAERPCDASCMIIIIVIIITDLYSTFWSEDTEALVHVVEYFAKSLEVTQGH